MRLYRATVLLCLQLLSLAGSAQTCHYKISGKVLDGQHQAVPGVIVRLPDDSLGAVTDSVGKFSIANVCRGEHTVSFEAISFKTSAVAINVDGDKELKISLAPGDNTLGEVVVNGSRVPVQDLHTVTATELKGLALLQTRGESLGESLKELPGLNSVQTGPTLSKPVIHGLYSNRVLIINDGVRQEGQQWGSEHAPEIDPFVANKITVVKGAASVRYGSDAIGGVVLLSPDDLPTLKSISGDVYLVGASNGQMGAFSGMLQGAFDKKLKGLSWRVQGTAKDAGNFHTPRYYLLNTGLKEGDFSANADYKLKRFDLNCYYSQYNTRVGICTDAQSGNYDELLRKIAEETPDAPSYFTYNTDRPYQTVYHDLLKATSSYTFKNNDKLELTLGRQSDTRKEYDDLSTASAAAENSPQLSFQLITQTVDLIYTQRTKNGFSGSAGFTGSTSGNVFEGVRYLIPNFRSYNGGAFAIERYDRHKFTFEAGVRYDYRWLRVYERNANTLGLYEPTHDYSNFTGTIGGTYRFNSHFSANLNIGSGWRAPSINELYINGEHFSEAVFEVGDSTLKSERSVNTGLSVNYTSNKLRTTVDLYYNDISNYIYDTFAHQARILASGSFPVFNYGQANVVIHGIDAIIQYDLLRNLTLQSKTTIVRGYNETVHDNQVGMPADRFQNGVEYHLPTTGSIKDPYVSIENVSVLKQTRTRMMDELAPPPGGYSLFNANAGFTLPIKRNTLNINFAVNNITNVAYRDYLDHFRYYVDELGINYILRLKYSF